MELIMIISPAYAQAAGAGGAGGIFGALLPFFLIFVVFYFLLIRPQQKRAKEHQSMVSNLKKGDIVITAGGISGKVTKATEGNESVDVEIAKGVSVSILRHFISECRDKDGRVLSGNAQQNQKAK
jgi:preprotein translocase subunit YajC